MLDCLIIGGGPAGLTAATYLARYRRIARVIDSGRAAQGKSRSRITIRASRELPVRTCCAAARSGETFGADIRSGEVTDLIEQDGGFVASIGDESVEARTVLMATGLIDKSPASGEPSQRFDPLLPCL